MKMTVYMVWFSNENYNPQGVSVEALNQGEALILAQAERIKDGLDYTLHKIEVLLGVVQATLDELNLDGVPFPSDFTPRFYAGHDPHDEGICWWHVFDSEPVWDDGYWESDGDSYEIGSYENGDVLPKAMIGLLPRGSLVKIVESL